MSWNWQTWAGIGIGALAGAWAGKKFGPKRHSTIAQVVGGIGGAVAGSWAGAAVSGAAVLPAVPASTGTVTLNVVAGSANAQIAAAQTLNLQLPTGASFSALYIDSRQVLGGAVNMYPLSGLAVGQHNITATWADSTGATQSSQINLTVTAS